MLPRFTRFERRILLSILLSGLVPFVLSLIYIPQIVETGLSLHEQVQGQLERSAVTYKELFDAKKKEFAARLEAMAKDPVLLLAAEERRGADVEARLEEWVEDEPDLRELRVILPSGDLLAEVSGPPERHTPEFTAKIKRRPLGPAQPALALEVVFLMPAYYVQAADEAEDIAFAYASSIKTMTTVQSEVLRGYTFTVTAFLILALAIGYAVARRVTKRITRLASATVRVAQGDLDFDIPLRGRDEITELTRAFNEMITEVKQARDRIVYLEKVSGWQEFARRLAHEIKNPLTPIQLAVQELRRRTPEGEPAFKKLVEDAADVVEEEIASLTRLVDEFSQFARLPEVVPEPVEVRAFVEDFLAAYNRFEPDAEVTTELPEAPVTAMIDRVLMRRVLANLATNAIQAVPAGQAKLVISCRATPGGAVVLRMQDNGPGVPREMADRIFDPYFTTKPEGTGLGLAIVKKIVLQHGGTIALEEVKEGGAAFVITLPAPLPGRTAPP
ncbi:MAG: HAMP domain-containing protein [Deltaproteobacteria bacterium]|nr:HAMP domain-containing protein [Deltaproteobacteria bacterium]